MRKILPFDYTTTTSCSYHRSHWVIEYFLNSKSNHWANWLNVFITNFQNFLALGICHIGNIHENIREFENFSGTWHERHSLLSCSNLQACPCKQYLLTLWVPRQVTKRHLKAEKRQGVLSYGALSIQPAPYNDYILEIMPKNEQPLWAMLANLADFSCVTQGNIDTLKRKKYHNGSKFRHHGDQLPWLTIWNTILHMPYLSIDTRVGKWILSHTEL